jgi:hypothetical protein
VKRLGRIVVGYRDDLELSTRWWHRLLKVCLIIGVPVLFVAIGDNTFYSYTNAAGILINNRKYAITLAAIATAFYTLLALNLYYRAIVYIICGPRKKQAAPVTQEII